MSSVSTPLGDLQIGDRVVVKRNLDHPAHMKQVPADPRDGGTKWVRDENIDESVAVSTIVERRHHPSVTGRWLARPARTLVRLRSGLWYDLATGLQEGSGATRIERRS